MKWIEAILCYPDMDRIYVRKESDLEKYDLSKVSAIDMKVTMTVEEFKKTWLNTSPKS